MCILYSANCHSVATSIKGCLVFVTVVGKKYREDSITGKILSTTKEELRSVK